MGVGVEEAGCRQGKTGAREFGETVVFLKSARRAHRGNGARRGERGVGGGCVSRGIMENGSVQGDRSEREFQYGRADRLANRVRASEARGLAAAKTEMDLRLMSVGRAVAAREPAWILKRG